MKKQKNMAKIVLVLSSALTTCLSLLQCYSILALKLMQDRSQNKLYRVGSSIVEKQRHWSIQKYEVQVSYDFVC